MRSQVFKNTITPVNNQQKGTPKNKIKQLSPIVLQSKSISLPYSCDQDTNGTQLYSSRTTEVASDHLLYSLRVQGGQTQIHLATGRVYHPGWVQHKVHHQ